MALATAAPGLWARLDQRGRLVVICGMAAVVAYLGGGGATVGRALVGGFGLLVFVLIAFSGRDSALVLIVAWLALLGFVRRALIPFVGWAGDDPLLLVAPAAAAVLWFAGRTEAPLRRSVLTVMTTLLILWAGAQMVNPSEPSLIVAARGYLFYFTPLMWFFVGRTLPAGVHNRVLDTVLVMNVVVAGHGLYQSFIGFLPFELTWLHVSNQGAAVFLPGFKVRPFSTLVSPQEYGIFLSFSAMIIASRLAHPLDAGRGWTRKRLAVALVVTLVALFFQGARGALMLTLLGLAVVTIVRARSALAFFGIATVVAGLAVWTGSQDVRQQEVEGVAGGAPTAAGAVVGHQLSGLTNPSSSSATLHVEQAIQGFEDALANPLGLGSSEATIAGARAEGPGATPETDVGNTMLALGIPGGLALVTLIVAGFAAAGRAYRIAPCARHLAWLGILVVGLGQWLNGGLYAVSTILFLSLGGLARHRELVEPAVGAPR
ncbi:MAG TPA: hypothetical protein VM618_09530 [Acidimicrobiia bacterium]|nr:hypothetical protein [Acidimicrobiia bacterium]